MFQMDMSRLTTAPLAVRRPQAQAFIWSGVVHSGLLYFFFFKRFEQKGHVAPIAKRSVFYSRDSPIL